MAGENNWGNLVFGTKIIGPRPLGASPLDPLVKLELVFTYKGPL